MPIRTLCLSLLVLLSTAFPSDTDGRLRDLVRTHIQDAVTHEWPEMARRNVTLTLIPVPLAEALTLIAAHSRPFTGELSVSPAILQQVMPEAGGAAAS